MLRKWYFCTNHYGFLHAFEQIQVAVLSARQHTSLAPVCLFDPGDDPASVAAQLAWLWARGVRLVPHQASLLPDLRARYGSAMDVFSGHWLRCDIPIIETDEKYVLYTDIDVMFEGPLSDNKIWPDFVACAPEQHQEDTSYFNSGVMIMNLPRLRPCLPELTNIVKRRFDFAAPHDDQGALNDLFRCHWEQLPVTWNWKPYWGRSNQARIVHFHGPKPGLANRLLTGEREGISATLLSLFDRNPDGYEYYCKRFAAVLTEL